MVNPTLYSFAFFILFFQDSAFTGVTSLKIFTILSQRIEENKVSFKKKSCYNDIDSGLWGERCRDSTIDRENCALCCLSPACYELIYQNDPLEEGERDQIREQEYRFCMRRHGDGLEANNMDEYHTMLKGSEITRDSRFAHLVHG